MPKLIKRIFFSSGIIVLFSLLITACTSSTAPSEAYKGESPQEVYLKGKGALQDKNYGEAVKRFEALDVQYPYYPDTESAQLYLIYAYYMKEEYPLAVAAADHYIRLHPTSPNVDYAYYLRGISDYYQNLGVIERFFSIDLATRDLTQMQKSYSDFNELVVRFPNSRYTPAAHQYMVYLRNMMAEHELHIAEYYYERKAYIAAADRASNVVAHYQGAPAVINSLVLMAKSYHQLGLTQSEQETLLVLKYNYPNVNVNAD